MLLPGNGWLRLNQHSYYQITHKPVYQNNYFPVILLSGYNSPFNGWLRFTHFDLPNYPFIRIIPLTAILLNKYFPQKQKEKSFKSSPARLNAKAPSMPILPRKLAPFNAILIITLGVYQTPLQHTQMAQKGIHGCSVLSQNVGKQRGTKFTDPFRKKLRKLSLLFSHLSGHKKRALINNINCCQQKPQKSWRHSPDTGSPNWTRRLKHRFGF